MPARLVVKSGRSEGEIFNIADEMVRIGSGPESLFRFTKDGLASHAATLEFRDGRYHLHNRSKDVIELEGRRLSMRESAPWSVGEDADFGHGVIVSLEVEGDPAPAPPNKEAYSIEYDADESEESEQEKTADKKQGFMYYLQWVAILALIPAIALLVMDPGAKTGAVAKGVSFTEVINKLANSSRDNDRGRQSFRLAIQRARAAELHNDQKEARKIYAAIRNELVAIQQPDGAFRNEDDKLVWDYVKGRIRKLHQLGEEP